MKGLTQCLGRTAKVLAVITVHYVIPDLITNRWCRPQSLRKIYEGKNFTSDNFYLLYMNFACELGGPSLPGFSWETLSASRRNRRCCPHRPHRPTYNSEHRLLCSFVAHGPSLMPTAAGGRKAREPLSGQGSLEARTRPANASEEKLGHCASPFLWRVRDAGNAPQKQTLMVLKLQFFLKNYYF